MSNYSKTTDFEAKDSLPTGDSGKIIRGSEFETEFDAISTAIATKADTAGPTFTGTLTFETISDGAINITAFVDEDNMASNSATLVPTQQSVKAYVDSQLTAQDLDFQADSGGALSIDLDSETLTFTGGTGIDTSGSGNAVTFAIDSTVATLTGSQTLTNKSLTAPTLTGTAVVASLDISGDIDVDGTTNLDVVDIDGAVDFASTTAHAGNASFADNARIILGSGNDLQIYHDGSNSYIEEGSGGAGTGDIIIKASNFQIQNGGGTQAAIKTFSGGTTELYHGGSKKLATTSTGIDVTGVITTDGMTTSADINLGDDDKAVFGAGSDLEIFHESSTGRSFIKETGSDEFRILGSDIRIKNGGDSKTYMQMTDGGSVAIRHNDATKLETSSTGIDVTGNAVTDGLTVDGNSSFTGTFEISGASPKIFLSETDTTDLNTRMRNAAGKLQIQTVDNSDANPKTRFQIDHSTGDISFYEDTGTTAKFFWDASAERLGIGSSSPAATLDVVKTGAGIQDTLQLRNAQTLAAGVGSSLGFGDSGGARLAYIAGAATGSNNDNGYLSFYTRASDSLAERMRIDSSGNVLVGTTTSAPQNFSSGSGTQISDGYIAAARGGAVALLNRVSTDGDIVEFKKDGSTVGSVGSSSGRFYIHNNYGSGAGIRFDNASLRPSSATGASEDATTDLGSSGARWKELYLSSGVYLGGTGAANLLDDYEEGTWTPVLVGTSGGSVTFTSKSYVKVGKVVTCIISNYNKDTSGLSGNVQITGLPFTSASDEQAVAIHYRDGGTAGDSVLGYIAASGTTMQVRENRGSATGAVNIAATSAVSIFTVFTYQTA